MAFNLTSFLFGALQIIAGAFLLATGVGGGIGIKLILGGVLTFVSSAMTAKTGKQSFSSSPTYGWGNLGNAAYEGSPIPVIYGEHLIKPGIVSRNVKKVGGVYYLYLLCVLGHGPITTISQVRLNDVETTNETFPGASVAFTFGSTAAGSNAVIPGFNETGIAYDQTGSRLAATQSLTYDMKAIADALTIALEWQGGLYFVDSKGVLVRAYSTVKIEYRAFGSTGPWAVLSPTAADGPDWTKTATGAWLTEDKNQNAVHRTIELKFGGTGQPARGRYSIRITNDQTQRVNESNIPTVKTVVEVTNDQRTYDGYAMLGIKLPASAQFTGVPSVSCVVKGRTVLDPRTSTTAWSDNPVLCARDYLTNATYGLGADSSKIDSTTWNALATVCDTTVTPAGGGTAEKAHTLDYILDVHAPGVDHLIQMLAGCGMEPIEAQRKIYLVQDSVKASSRVFEGRQAAAVGSRWNIRDGDGRSSLIATSLDLSQRWTSVRCQYLDRSRGWQQRTVTVRDIYANIGAITGGPFVVTEKIKGTTSKAIGRLSAGYANGAAWVTYTQDDGAVPFQNGETITGLTSGATAALSSAPYTLSADRPLDVQLYGVTRRSEAIRKARRELNNARSRTTFASWGGFLGDLDLLPGAVVTIGADHLPWTAKPFVLLKSGFDGEGMATFSAREYVADVYSDNVDTSVVDAQQYYPGGSVPPALRPPPTPTDSGSTNNTAGSVDLTSGFFGSGAQSGTPFGAATDVKVTVTLVGSR